MKYENFQIWVIGESSNVYHISSVAMSSIKMALLIIFLWKSTLLTIWKHNEEPILAQLGIPVNIKILPICKTSQIIIILIRLEIHQMFSGCPFPEHINSICSSARPTNDWNLLLFHGRDSISWWFLVSVG